MLNKLPKTSKGHLFVLSGPAGSGKTTLVDRLTLEFPHVKKNVSYTTRAKRAGETEGVDYHFVDLPTFEEMEARGEFLETVHLFNSNYGTSVKAILNQLEQGYHLVLVLDVEGAKKVKEMLEVPLLFVTTPDLQTLEKRLTARCSEKPQDLEKRLERARFEISQGEKYYDYLFVNDDLDAAYQILQSILVAELHKRKAIPARES